MTGKCKLCNVEMEGTTPDNIDCGGDCSKCLRDFAGDPDCSTTEFSTSGYHMKTYNMYEHTIYLRNEWVEYSGNAFQIWIPAPNEAEAKALADGIQRNIDAAEAATNLRTAAVKFVAETIP